MGLLRILVVFIFVSMSVSAQIQKDKILFGAYLGPSNNVNQTHYDFSLPLAAGLNFANQRLIVGIPVPYQATNVTNPSLLQFPYILAQNDSGGSTYKENGLDKPIVKYKPNYDLIYYYTCGYIKKWEAEGDDDFPSGSENYNAFKLTYGTGSEYNEGSVAGWQTGLPIDSLVPGTPVHLFTIPKFVMHSRYKYTNKYLRTNQVRYNLVVRLKGSGLSLLDPSAEVLSIGVRVYDEITLVSHSTIFLTREQISDKYNEIINVFTIPETNNPNGLAKEIKVDFEIKWYNRGDLFIDYINIYDSEIGDRLLNYYTFEKNNLSNSIAQLSNQFMTEASFHQKLHLFSGIDEAHSIYSMEPFRIVRQMLSELGVQQKLQTKLYHSLDNDANNFNTFQGLVKKSNPKSLMYWYYPFYWNDTQKYGVGKTISKKMTPVK